jgi:hypothetical protein
MREPAKRPAAWRWVLSLGVLASLLLGARDHFGGLPAPPGAALPAQAPTAAVATGPRPVPEPAAAVASAPASQGAASGRSRAAATERAAGPTGGPAASATDGVSAGSEPGGLAGASSPGVEGPEDCAARVPGSVPASAASDYLDTYQAVAFTVVATKDTGKVTFLNSRVPYQGHFYVAVFPTLYEQFPAPPATYFRGKCIVVQGQVELYRGTVQMVLRGVEDVRVVEGP